MDVEQPLPLLGGLSPARFMQRHWQKKPLLVRQAIRGIAPLLSRAELFALAADAAVESRLIVRGADGWQLKRGPLARRALPPLAQRDWTLLVQGVDLHDERAHALLQQFRFVPDARLDDLMISYAIDAGRRAGLPLGALWIDLSGDRDRVRQLVQLDAPHQQRPVALRPRRQGAARQRPAFELPAVGAADDQPRFHGRVSGQREQLGARQKRLDARHGLAHQQRLFLPMALHEAGGRQAAQQWQGLIDIHGASIRKAAEPLPAMRQSAPWKSAPNLSSPSPGP